MTAARSQDRDRLLYAQLRWMMRLRWVAAAVILGGASANWLWFRWFEGAGVLLAVGAAVAAYNALLSAADRRLLRLHSSDTRLLAFATAQLYLDIASLTLLVLFTGGVHSPIIGFFIFHMGFASLLLPRPRALVAAVISVLCVAAGLWWNGQPPRGLVELLAAAGWACTLIVTVLLMEGIAHALYRRERIRMRQNRRLRELSNRLRAHQEAMVQTEKLAAMGQLAAGVAHEITNPLASMDSVLQLMQRRPDSPRPDAVNSMREQVQRIYRTVKQLTAFAHPGDGRFELAPLNDVVSASIELLHFDKRLARVKLERSLPPEVGTIRMNVHAIEQVLTNLLRNALDALEHTPEPRISVRTARHDRQCLIEVTDNGSGITPDKLPRVFDPFFTTKPVGQGTGMGLSISANLIREHGGWIRVTSEPARATTFTIHLPLEPATHDSRPHDPTNAPLDPEPHTPTNTHLHQTTHLREPPS